MGLFVWLIWWWFWGVFLFVCLLLFWVCVCGGGGVGFALVFCMCFLWCVFDGKSSNLFCYIIFSVGYEGRMFWRLFVLFVYLFFLYMGLFGVILVLDTRTCR